MIINSKKATRRAKIVHRIRKKISGTAQRPRLCVYKSNRFFYVQLIDDTAGHTLVAEDSRKKTGSMAERVVKVGEQLAQKAVAKQLSTILFDRAGYRYHGHVKLLSETVRAKGLQH